MKNPKRKRSRSGDFRAEEASYNQHARTEEEQIKNA
jgi:hypothetical protein